MSSATDTRVATTGSGGGSHAEAARQRRFREGALAYGFLAPQLIGLLVFMIGPLIFAVVLAFLNWDGFGNKSFAGLSNFAWVFTDPQMQTSMKNTLWFTILQVPGLLVSGFFAAVLLQTTMRMKNVYRTFFARRSPPRSRCRRSGCYCSTRNCRRSTPSWPTSASPRPPRCNSADHPDDRVRLHLAGLGLPAGDVHGRAGERAAGVV